MSEPLITVKKLDKTFGARWALRNVTFQVNQGEIVALVGPNGAGKTTMLRIIATLNRPDDGSIAIGRIPLAQHANAARSSIGFVGHQTFMYDDLTAEENLTFYARLYDIANIPQRIREVAQRPLRPVAQRDVLHHHADHEEWQRDLVNQIDSIALGRHVVHDSRDIVQRRVRSGRGRRTCRPVVSREENERVVSPAISECRPPRST